jgi:beta-lactamase class A
MLALGLCILATAIPASTDDLDRIAREAAESAHRHFPNLKEDQLGVSVARIDRRGKTYAYGSHRGNEKMYPASVVKAFFLAHLAHQLDEGRLVMTPELERATRDMIVDSSNDATALVVDTLTGTTGGPELPPDELERWMDRRQEVNRWFASLGYAGVNACQKTWNEAPYGRERQGYGPNWEHRNMLTPNACTRLFADIMLDRLATPERSQWMRAYLARPIPADGEVKDPQSSEYIGQVLPKGSKLWSKAGWTSQVRMDAAAVELPDGMEVVLVVFTRGHSREEGIVPHVAQELLRRMTQKVAER